MIPRSDHLELDVAQGHLNAFVRNASRIQGWRVGRVCRTHLDFQEVLINSHYRLSIVLLLAFKLFGNFIEAYWLFNINLQSSYLFVQGLVSYFF